MKILPVRTRGVAILGAPGPVTEHVRKVLHALGHPPLLFHSLDDLRAFETNAHGLAMLFVVTPAELARCLLGCRQLVGAVVPIVAFANAFDEITDLAARQHLAHEITVAPTRLADMFVLLQCAMDRHQLTVRKPILQRGSLRFYPESSMVGTSHKHFVLTPALFDVLFELAFAPEVLQPPAWLVSIAHRHGVGLDELRADIPKLRQRVGLVPSRGWRLAASARSGYWLGAVTAMGKREVLPKVIFKTDLVVKEVDPAQVDIDLEFAAFMRGAMPPSVEYSSPERIFQNQLPPFAENSLW